VIVVGVILVINLSPICEYKVYLILDYVPYSNAVTEVYLTDVQKLPPWGVQSISFQRLF
jgi:hypothetical protein